MYKNILLPIDLAQESSWKKALPVALELCEPDHGVLHIVSVVPDFGSSLVSTFFNKSFEQKAIEETKEKLKDFIARELPGNVEVKGHVVHGTIYEEVLDAAEHYAADVIVLSSHRPELKDYLLGPNAARIVRHAKQSVMVVRD